jgi:hypothetical protein
MIHPLKFGIEKDSDMIHPLKFSIQKDEADRPSEI